MSSLSYDDWNQAIGRHVFHEGNAGRPIRFAIDPIILQRAAEFQKCHHFRSPEEAAADFRSVVTQRIVQGGWDFGTPKVGETPLGLAKLALQVLAVFDIETDDEGHGGYWLALNRMFGRDEHKRMPLGRRPDLHLTPKLHQEAWGKLARWTLVESSEKFGILGVPDDGDLKHRHVRLPLHHGLLRMEDFKSLPRFFGRASLTPGEELEPEELEVILREYAQDTASFPRVHARRVLKDGRLPLAAVQVANALAQWDGSDPFDLKAERKAIRLWFSIPRHKANMIRGGLVEIKPGTDPLDVYRVELCDVLGKKGARGLESPVRYRPIRRRPILAVYSAQEERCIEARGFDPGDQIILARPSRENDRDYEQRLRAVAAGGKVEIVHPDPSLGWPGWVVFQLKVRDNVTATELRPLGLEKCLKPAGPRLRLSGGKRAGRPWLEGDGPTLAVFRGGGSATVIVDGQAYQTVENQLTPARCPALGAVGTHEAWIPGRYHGHVRFQVKRPVSPPPEQPPTQPDPEPARRHRPAPDPPTPPPVDDAIDQSSLVEASPPDHTPAAWVALQLAIALRRPNPARRSATAKLVADNLSHPNTLVRQLARALAATRGGSNV